MIISQGAFADLVVCLTEFSKNLKFQKKSIAAIETLKSTVPKMLKTPECPLSHRVGSLSNGVNQEGVSIPKLASRQTQEEQYWFPVLFAFHDVLMTGDDLEVRSLALNYLFDTLIKYGGDFPRDFWDILWRQLLYPIFMVLRSKSEMSKVQNHEDLSVWLSTTMIEALRNMMSLFTHYFDSLEYMLDRFLDLLALCICQENDTIARIGSNCLQTLILQNVTKFRPEHWSKIVTSFVELFDRTTAHQLFSAATASSESSYIADGESVRRATNGGIETADLPITGPKSKDTPSSPTQTSQHEDSVETASLYRSASPPHQSSTVTSELEDYRPQSELQQQPVVVTTARRKFFNKIITRCVLQLLMIETVNELFSNDSVYAQIPSSELLRLMSLLKGSYSFAKRFNNNKELRMRLWREGFMKQPPNLLKQESGSAATYVNILVRMYHDEGDERRRSRADTEAALIPYAICFPFLSSFSYLVHLLIEMQSQALRGYHSELRPAGGVPATEHRGVETGCRRRDGRIHQLPAGGLREAHRHFLPSRRGTPEPRAWIRSTTCPPRAATEDRRGQDGYGASGYSDADADESKKRFLALLLPEIESGPMISPSCHGRVVIYCSLAPSFGE